jgi:hypothetical protein
LNANRQFICRNLTLRNPPDGCRVWLLTGALLLAAGCGTVSSVPADPDRPAAAEPIGQAKAPDEAAPAAPAGTTLTDAERARVAQLLDRADRAIAADHLTYPAAGSALDLYDQVRILDPDNEAARRGLERIVERYLELAMTALERRRFEQARAMMDRARLVDPDHPGIPPTQAQIELLDTADRQVIPLDPEALRNRDAQVADAVRQAGAASRTDGCRAEITARSDSEGRWIYQQMSAAGSPRIQAQLNIGSPPRIEVLCFRQ